MKNYIDELLSYDAIEQVEKITKKNWENFSIDEEVFAIALNFANATQKEKIFKQNNDTYMNMSWNYFINLISSSFKLATKWKFDKKWNDKINHEIAVIYYKPGILLYADSFNNGTTVNSGYCFYEAEFPEGTEDYCNLIHTGCAYKKYRIENMIDIREGLFYNLDKVKEYGGNFLIKWEGDDPLWINDYVEVKEYESLNWDDKFKKYDEITKKHILKCPKEVQDMINIRIKLK